MNPKHVLIVNKGSLLMGYIEHLLETSGEFIIVSTLANNAASLFSIVEQSKPDVVVINDLSFSLGPIDLITSLENIRNVRLIIMNSEFNKMDIYDKNEITFSNSGQLIDAIRSENTLSNK